MALVSCSSAGLRVLSAARRSTSLLTALCSPRLVCIKPSFSVLKQASPGATGLPQYASLQVARFTASQTSYEAGSAQPESNEVYQAEYDPESRNVVCLTGILGRDIELKTMATGKYVTNTSLAVNVSKDQPTNWYDVSIFGDLAESAKRHLSKGSRVVVHGYLRQSFWDDKATGQKRSKTGVVATNIGLLPRNEYAPADEYAADSGMQAAYVAQWPQTNEQQAAPSYNAQPQQGVDMPSQPRDDAERQWIDMLNNTSEWWDNRHNKRNPKQPDFKHKTAGTALWMTSRGVPDWVPGKVNEVFGP